MIGSAAPPRQSAAVVLLLILALGGCQASFFGVLNAGLEGPRERAPGSASYGSHPAQTLDIFRPVQPAPNAALVVFFYGGRWDSGRREWYRFVGSALAERGIVTLVPDYRVYPEVKFPGFVEDAALATAWAIRNAASLGADPHRVFVAGHSAGAHLAAMVASDARYLAPHGHAPRDLAGAIGVAGPYNVIPDGDAALEDMFGPPERYPAARPVNFADGDEPPFLLLHGSDDRLVWASHSDMMADRLKQAGIAVEYSPYPGIGHIRILAAIRYPRFGATLADMVAFVERTPAAQAVAP